MLLLSSDIPNAMFLGMQIASKLLLTSKGMEVLLCNICVFIIVGNHFHLELWSVKEESA